MNMKDGSVTLAEVVDAFKALTGKASAKQIESFVITSRGNILPKKYQRGGWDSYRKTINQVIQVHTMAIENIVTMKFLRSWLPVNTN
jgi:hypothetical protein